MTSQGIRYFRIDAKRWGVSYANSLHMTIHRKEYRGKRGPRARVAPPRANQLTAAELYERKHCLSGIVAGQPVSGWHVVGTCSEPASDARFNSLFSKLLTATFLAEPNCEEEHKFFLVQTKVNLGGDDLHIFAVMDRDPNTLSVDPAPIVSERALDRSSDFRTKVLEGPDMLNASEAAAAMGVTRQHIHSLYKSEKLIGLIHPARERGVRYPRWQFEAGLVGQPLRELLEVLRGRDAWDKWLFFTSKDDALAGFSPVEIMTGKAKVVPHSKVAAAIMQEPLASRLQKVLSAAKGYVGL